VSLSLTPIKSLDYWSWTVKPQSLKMVTGKRVYNWYISMAAASCMVLYGYDASVYNSVLGSDNWLKWNNVYPSTKVNHARLDSLQTRYLHMFSIPT